MGKRRSKLRHPLTGALRQGHPIERDVAGVLELPPNAVDSGEEIYEVREYSGDEPNIRIGDLLVIRPAARAASGQLVVAELKGRAYLGRWWTKQGRRALLAQGDLRPIVEDRGLRLVGVVTTLMRYGLRGRRQGDAISEA